METNVSPTPRQEREQGGYKKDKEIRRPHQIAVKTVKGCNVGVLIC